MQEHFEWRPDWYRCGEVQGLVLAYYALLREVLGEKPHLRGSLTRCRCCGIFFPSHPRNWGRRDLLCPFGCRQAHMKRSSTQRSVEYYRTKEGKVKKRQQNRKRHRRRKKGASGRGAEARLSGGAPAETQENSSKGDVAAPGDEGVPDETMIEQVRMMTSMFEDREVSREEVLKMLARAKVRQQGIGGEEKNEYRDREVENDTS